MNAPPSSPLFSPDLRLTLGRTPPRHPVSASVDQKVKESALGIVLLALVSVLVGHCSQCLVLHVYCVWFVHAVGQPH